MEEGDMFHAGLALELSRIVWDDRRAEATAGRGRSGRKSPRSRAERAPVGDHVADARIVASDDPWWAWRVVEPDAEYLRRRAA
jgi:hypothetical protein